MLKSFNYGVTLIQTRCDQTQNRNWKVVHRDDIPVGATILPAEWSMKQKHCIKTQKIYKWKAGLNINGSKQTKGVNFWEMYMPIASWPSICMILTLAILNNWKTKQVDFILAYLQALVEIHNLYMKILRGFKIKGANKDKYLLYIQKNIYGQAQAGCIWNKHLIEKLVSIGFKQS
jgi:hypothetical protein